MYTGTIVLIVFVLHNTIIAIDSIITFVIAVLVINERVLQDNCFQKLNTEIVDFSYKIKPYSYFNYRPESRLDYRKGLKGANKGDRSHHT